MAASDKLGLIVLVSGQREFLSAPTWQWKPRQGQYGGERVVVVVVDVELGQRGAQFPLCRRRHLLVWRAAVRQRGELRSTSVRFRVGLVRGPAGQVQAVPAAQLVVFHSRLALLRRRRAAGERRLVAALVLLRVGELLAGPQRPKGAS